MQRTAMNIVMEEITTTRFANQSEVDWMDRLKDAILYSHYCLYIFVPIAAGHIADISGAKWVAFTGAAGPFVLSPLKPIGLKQGGPLVLIALQIIEGAFHGCVYASLFSLYTKWFTARERVFANGSLFFGGSLGTMVTCAMTGWAFNTHTGWPLLFYTCASLYLPWMVLWIYFVDDDPKHSRRISEQELSTIKQNVPQWNSLENRKRKTPWLAIITSKTVLCSMFVKMCSGFGYFFLIFKMDLYFQKEYFFILYKGGVLSAGKILIQGLIALMAGPLSNWIIFKFALSLMAVRKAFQLIAMMGAALCIVSIPSMDITHAVFSLYIGGMFFYGLFTGGEWSTISEYAPNCAGVVFGVTNALAFAMAVVVPLLTGFLLDVDYNKTEQRWNAMFYVTSVLYAVGPIPFLLFGTDKQQKWDKAMQDEESEGGGCIRNEEVAMQ